MEEFKVGDKVVVTEIHPADAHYWHRDKIIGEEGVITDLWCDEKVTGYIGHTVRYNSGPKIFLAVKMEKVDNKQEVE